MTVDVAVHFGTRPEAIKVAPVILALRKVGLAVHVVATGQHRELAREVLPLFGLAVDDDLDLMRPGQTLDYVLSRGVELSGGLIDRLRPRSILVQGDTTSALAVSLAAFHHDVPVAHVEAGLRTGDLSFPFPEEMNRRVIATLARWHFAPTDRARANLAAEGIRAGVSVTGNTVVDALRAIARAEVVLPAALEAFLDDRPYLLATAHRRESWGVGIRSVALALREVALRRPQFRILFISHPNPAARRPAETVLAGIDNVLLLDALEYPLFIRLLGGAALAVSDSGGVQEEGPTVGVPVLVTRTKTERPEGVTAGAVRVVGTDTASIVRTIEEILEDEPTRSRMAEAGRRLYGDGRAGVRIARVLSRALTNTGGQDRERG